MSPPVPSGASGAGAHQSDSWGNGPPMAPHPFTRVQGPNGGPAAAAAAAAAMQRGPPTAADTQALISKSPMPEYWCSIQYYELDTQVLPFPRNANPHIHRRINFTT